MSQTQAIKWMSLNNGNTTWKIQTDFPGNVVDATDHIWIVEYSDNIFALGESKNESLPRAFHHGRINNPYSKRDGKDVEITFWIKDFSGDSDFNLSGSKEVYSNFINFLQPMNYTLNTSWAAFSGYKAQYVDMKVKKTISMFIVTLTLSLEESK